MINIKNLHKKFGKLIVLDNLNLSINKGGVFAILGPNGSGKTTLIKALLGMVVPNKGEIFYNNKSILNKWEYRTNINYLPQIANFPANLTVIELINMVKNLRGSDTNEKELTELFGLTPFLKQKPCYLLFVMLRKIRSNSIYKVAAPHLPIVNPVYNSNIWRKPFLL